MKQSRFYILFFFVVCIGLFCSCLSNDDDAQWSKFNGVYVTVGGDNIRGYKLYTDFGAILVPTEESLNRIPWLKEVQRAIVSFNLLDENENTTQLEDGKTYDVILNSTNGMNQQIPTFTVHVDTLSEEYQIFGQDSIQLKNKSIYSLDKTAEAFYIKNGYGEFYQFNLSSCIRQQNSLTAQFVSFSLSNLANIFYPPNFYNN